MIKKINNIIKDYEKMQSHKLKSKKKNKKQFNATLWALFMMISLVLILSGCFYFSAGYHNVDLSHNFMIVEKMENINLVDYGSTYMIHELEYYYVTGFNQMLLGFLLFGYGCLIFGYYLCCAVVNYVK